MPDILATCDDCSYLFPSGIFAENVINLTLNNIQTGPCPRCGGIGHTKNGVFNVIDGIIHQLKDLDYNKEEIAELSETIKSINKNLEVSEEFERVIKKENPKFSFLLDLLPKNREEKVKFIYALIPILISLLPYFINSTPDNIVENNIIIEHVINNVYESSEDNFEGKVYKEKSNVIGKAAAKPKEKKEPIRSKKNGRNQPCPCGSGLKFKKCHGK